MTSENSSKNMSRLEKLALFRLEMIEEDTQKRFEKKADQVEQERLADIERARIATVKENVAQFGLEKLEEEKETEFDTELDSLFKEKWNDDIQLVENARRTSYVPVDNRRKWSTQERNRLAEYRQRLEQERILRQIRLEQKMEQERLLQKYKNRH